ncbi:MAG: hypothetical protein AB7G93_18185 [Bdellovibrionales bacterium]
MKTVMFSPPLAALVVSLWAFLLVACKSDNPGLTGPPPTPPPPVEHKPIQQTKDGPETTYDPRVDILFIIDDSRSMMQHQTKLSEGIKNFVDAIAKIQAIDFHIGYTVVHDHRRYGTLVPPVCGQDTTTPGRVNWEEPGTLRPLMGARAPKDGRRYVTKSDDFTTILRESLDPKVNVSLVKDLIDKDPQNPGICPYGPEEEELFTPLLGALQNPVVTEGMNKGFRRAGALFVAVLVSDAKDASGLSPEQVFMRMQNALGRGRPGEQKFRVFSVVIAPGTPIIGRGYPEWETSCKLDPDFSLGKGAGGYIWPNKDPKTGKFPTVSEDGNPLAVLAQLTRDENSKVNHVLSICDSNYGEALAKFGTQIQEDTLRDLEIPLNWRWETTNDPSKKLSVYLGPEKLVENEQWVANPNRASITVFGQKVDWNKYPNEKIRVVYTPVRDGAETTQPVFPQQ